MIINGDCAEELKKLPDKSVDVCITSPPYNIGIQYNTYADKRKDYQQFLTGIFAEITRVLKDDGHFFLNISPTREDPFFAYNIAKLVPMVVQNPIVWAKSIEIDEAVRGHGQVGWSDYYLCRGYEMVWHFTKTGLVPIDREYSAVSYQPEYLEDNKERTGRTTRPTTDCWFIGYETVGFCGVDAETLKGEKHHPAIFPRELVRHCIKVAGLRKGVVLDPFAGTGTVAVVCKEMGLDTIAIEIDKDYYDFILQKVEETVYIDPKKQGIQAKLETYEVKE